MAVAVMFLDREAYEKDPVVFLVEEEIPLARALCAGTQSDVIDMPPDDMPECDGMIYAQTMEEAMLLAQQINQGVIPSNR